MCGEKILHRCCRRSLPAKSSNANTQLPGCFADGKRANVGYLFRTETVSLRYQGITVRALFLFVGPCWQQVMRSPKPFLCQNPEVHDVGASSLRWEHVPMRGTHQGTTRPKGLQPCGVMVGGTVYTMVNFLMLQ